MMILGAGCLSVRGDALIQVGRAVSVAAVRLAGTQRCNLSTFHALPPFLPRTHAKFHCRLLN